MAASLIVLSTILRDIMNITMKNNLPFMLPKAFFNQMRKSGLSFDFKNSFWKHERKVILHSYIQWQLILCRFKSWLMTSENIDSNQLTIQSGIHSTYSLITDAGLRGDGVWRCWAGRRAGRVLGTSESWAPKIICFNTINYIINSSHSETTPTRIAKLWIFGCTRVYGEWKLNWICLLTQEIIYRASTRWKLKVYHILKLNKM